MSRSLWADYYLLLSQTEIITSENDGKAAAAGQLYFPAQLGERKPSHPVNNSMASPPFYKDKLSQSALSVSIATEGP